MGRREDQSQERDPHLKQLLDFHRSHGKLATVTAVQPPARFGNIELKGDRVEAFTEKVQRDFHESMDLPLPQARERPSGDEAP